MTVDNHDLILLHEVQRRVDGATEEQAAHILDAVAEALGELLTPDEARLVGPYVSDRLARILAKSALRHTPETQLADFVDGVSWRENVGVDVAIEHAHAVCEALIGTLPMDVQVKLRDDLPADVVEFFRGEGEPELAPLARRGRASA